MKENYRSVFILILFNIIVILLISLHVRGNEFVKPLPGMDGDEKYNMGVRALPSHVKSNAGKWQIE